MEMGVVGCFDVWCVVSALVFITSAAVEEKAIGRSVARAAGRDQGKYTQGVAPKDFLFPLSSSRKMSRKRAISGARRRRQPESSARQARCRANQVVGSCSRYVLCALCAPCAP